MPGNHRTANSRSGPRNSNAHRARARAVQQRAVERPVARAVRFVREHPLPTIGAAAAIGFGAYLIRR